jgi:hypothetical protein
VANVTTATRLGFATAAIAVLGVVLLLLQPMTISI